MAGYPYLVREKRTAVSFNIKKQDNSPIRYITVIYPTKDIKAAPKINARFVTSQFNDKKLEVEVSLNGEKVNLGYKLK